jgi:uncharacterized protein YqhQ
VSENGGVEPVDRPRTGSYGGQALLEGVMVRGSDRWAVAVRRPAGDVWLEAHPLPDPEAGAAWRRWPLLRGLVALSGSLRVGSRALRIAAARSQDVAPTAGRGPQPPTEGPQPRTDAPTGGPAGLALAVALSLFVVLPVALTAGLDTVLAGRLGHGVAFHAVESLARVAVFLAYLGAIARLPEIRRVFRYHGAEHQTIAAWEHGEVLSPTTVGRYPTAHVRCGTNFLVLVLLLAFVVFTLGGLLVPAPTDVGFLAGAGYHVALRLVLLPVVVGLAYESLRLGAVAGGHPIVAVLMAPGRWLQRVTTAEPAPDQVEVAIRAFEAAAPVAERVGRVTFDLPSPVTFAAEGLPIALTDGAGGVAPPVVDGTEGR